MLQFDLVYYAQHITRTNFSSSKILKEKNVFIEQLLRTQVNEILVETNLHINTEQIECKLSINCHHALQECLF